MINEEQLKSEYCELRANQDIYLRPQKIIGNLNKNSITLSFFLYNNSKENKTLKIKGRLGGEEYEQEMKIPCSEEKLFEITKVNKKDENFLEITTEGVLSYDGRPAIFLLYNGNIEITHVESPISQAKKKEFPEVDDKTFKKLLDIIVEIGGLEKFEAFVKKVSEVSKSILEIEENLKKSKKDIQEVKELAETYKKIEAQQIKGWAEKVKVTYNNIVETKSELHEETKKLMEEFSSKAKDDVGKIEKSLQDAEENQAKVSKIVNNLREIEEIIPQIKELVEDYKGIKPQQIKGWADDIKTTYDNTIKINEKLTEKTANLMTDISLKQNMLEEIKTNISKINESTMDNFSQAIVEKEKITEACEAILKKIEKIEPQITRIEQADLKVRGIEEIEGLKDKIYQTYIGRVPSSLSSMTTSDEITKKMEHIPKLLEPLRKQLFPQKGGIHKELSAIVEDFVERIEKRVRILKEEAFKPEIKEDIMVYDKYKEKVEKEVLISIFSEEEKIDLPSLDFKKSYQEYIDSQYKRYLLEFKKELEKQEARIKEANKTKQKEYDEFLNKDLIHLFIDSVDGIKKTNKQEKILLITEDYLNRIFDIVGIEPIEIEEGETKADSKLHIIEGTKVGDYEDGVVVEVISRGLRYKDDKTKILNLTLLNLALCNQIMM